MALRYFDGFETYGVIPAGTTANGVRSTVPLTAAGWSGTGITAALRQRQTQIVALGLRQRVLVVLHPTHETLLIAQ